MSRKTKRIVIKIGSSLLTHADGRIDPRRIQQFVRDISTLYRQGHQLLIVTSGAIAAGVGELKWKKRPTELRLKQAAAAVGQVSLMQQYRTLFSKAGITVAQILLTNEDFQNKKRYLNAQATVLSLLEERVIPIINENDTVAVDEIRLGDNDTLAALVAIKVKADLLVLFTDVDGLMTRPPSHGKGILISRIEKITPKIVLLAAGAGSERGTGGMITKLNAARRVMAKGVAMVIANGQKPGLLSQIVDGKSVGTYFAPR